MIFILFSLLADSIDVDTTIIDSTRVYEVPEIFSHKVPAITEKIPFQTWVIPEPVAWDMDMLDLIHSTNYYPYYPGPGHWLSIGSAGHSARSISMSINGRRIYDPFYGYADFLWFAPGMVEQFSIDHDHGIMPSVNISTRTNQDECPMSSLNYWGGANRTTLFDIAYSRPFNDQIGIYMNGYYDKGSGTRLNSDHRIYRFYMNKYLGSYIRSDLLYYSNEFGFPANDPDTNLRQAYTEVVDYGLGLGSKNHKILSGITSHRNRRPDVAGINPVQTRYMLLTLQNMNYLFWRKFSIKYGFETFYDYINSDLTPDIDNHHWITANIDITWASGNAVCQIKNKIEGNKDKIFCVPGAVAGYNIGNTAIFARAGRNIRVPTYLETRGLSSPFCDYYGWFHGNPELNNEDVWGGEIGLDIGYLRLTFYDYFYHCQIVPRIRIPDTMITFVDLPDQNIHGLTLNSDHHLHISKDTIVNKFLAIVLSAHIDHCLTDENIIGQPRTNVSTGIGIRHESDRLGFAVLINGRYAGERAYGSWTSSDHIFIISPVLHLRFIALSASLRIENILDQNYQYIPDYQMPGRHVLFGVKWDFRN